MKNNFLIFLDFTRKLYRGRSMIMMMAMRDIRARYVGSFFGFFWSVINPLVQVAIYGVVFGVFFASKPDPYYKTDQYMIFLLSGLIPWQFFAQAVGTTTTSVIRSSNLIRRAMGFPSEVMPIVAIIGSVVSHIIGMIVLFVAMILLSVKISPFTPFILVYLFLTCIFSIGLGWILSSLNVFFRDVGQMIGLITMGWFFFTPVFYSSHIVSSPYLAILKLNPLFHFVEGYRRAILVGELLPTADFIYLVVVSFVTFAVGGICFKKLKPWFAEFI